MARDRDRLLDVHQFAELFGGDPPPSKQTIKRWTKEKPGFPQPIILGPSTLRYSEAEGRAYVKKLPRGQGTWKVRKGDPPRPSISRPRPRKVRPESPPATSEAPPASLRSDD